MAEQNLEVKAIGANTVENTKELFNIQTRVDLRVINSDFEVQVCTIRISGRAYRSYNIALIYFFAYCYFNVFAVGV